MNPARHRSPNNGGRMTNVVCNQQAQQHTAAIHFCQSWGSCIEEVMSSLTALPHLMQGWAWSRVCPNAGGGKDPLWDKGPHSDQMLRSLLDIGWPKEFHGAWAGWVFVLMHTRAGWCRSHLKPRVGRSHRAMRWSAIFQFPSAWWLAVLWVESR